MNQTQKIPPWKKALPMQITYARIFITVPVVACMFSESLSWKLVSTALFIFAAITDYYDGHLARKYQASSNLGKFMDPIADKILVTSVLTTLLYLQKIDPFMAIIIFARDNFISGIRSAAAADNVIISAKNTGKWKTGLQMTGIPMLMLGNFTVPGFDPLFKETFTIPFEPIGYGILWIGVLFSVWSGLEYALIYWRSK